MIYIQVVEQVDYNPNHPLFLLDRAKMKTLPCFSALRGPCMVQNCGYNHHRAMLQKEFDRKLAEMNASPFAHFKPSGGGDIRRAPPAQSFSMPQPRQQGKSLFELNESNATYTNSDDLGRVHRSGNTFSPTPKAPVILKSSDKVCTDLTISPLHYPPD
jgi:hypothetical protein